MKGLVLPQKESEEELLVSDARKEADQVPSFSRPVDALRKSKVEARQYKRDQFRKKITDQKQLLTRNIPSKVPSSMSLV